MQHRKLAATLVLGALTFGFCAGPTLARSTQPEQALKSGATMQKQEAAKMQQHQRRMHGSRMRGRHMMPASVTSVDKKTGLMKVDSAGMKLTVHFPPPALTDVKVGDKITLFLGFREGDVSAMRKERMERRKKMMKKSASEKSAR